MACTRPSVSSVTEVTLVSMTLESFERSRVGAEVLPALPS